MRIVFLTAIVLVALAEIITAASTSGGDINQQLVLKLESLQQKLTTVQESLESSERNHEDELQRLRDEMEEKRQGRENESRELRQLVEILQAKLQFSSEESSSLKVQLINFFTTVSLANKKEWRQKPVESTEVEEDANAKSSDTGEVINEKNKEGVAASGSDYLNGNLEGFDGGITATLKISAPGGVSYTRWGRTTCEGEAEVLYTGYASGKYRTATNTYYAGSEIICLHGTPEWGNFSSAYRALAPMSGVKYSFSDDDPFSKENMGGQSLTNHDMPCSVCHLETRTHQLMIPARKSCPAGWTAEYWGYLVTSPYSNYGGNYQCLDQAPEGTASGSANIAATQIVYAAEINCGGALPCPPYFNGYEVSCVVCTK